MFTVLPTLSVSSNKVGAQAGYWSLLQDTPSQSSREAAQVSWIRPSKAALVPALPEPPCHDEAAVRVRGAGARSPRPSRACGNDLPPSLTRSHIWFQLVGR